MLAYLDTSNTPQPWSGQPIADGSGNPVYYPLDVENKWTADQLTAAGLYPVTLFVPPAGQVITGNATYTLNGTARTAGATVTQTFATQAGGSATTLFPQATDDSHAAGLTPPVPVGGLYCNGSQVMQRQS
jgi:hypothetical protein